LKSLKNILKNTEYQQIVKEHNYKIFQYIMKNKLAFSLIVKTDNIFYTEKEKLKFMKIFEEYAMLEFEESNIDNISYDENSAFVKIYFQHMDEVIPLKINYLDIYQILHNKEILSINLIPFFAAKTALSSFDNLLEFIEEENEVEVEKSIDILLSINGNDKFFNH
jgi:hypothetical protein